MCIRSRVNFNHTVLIVGKVYDAEAVTENIYIVNGWWESKDCFTSLAEHRNKQLESIGVFETL